MKLDLRRPTIVILGAWNPAIFSLGWCARYLFEYPPGQNIQVSSYIDVTSNTQVNYIDNIGINVTSNRFEIYCNEWNDDVVGRAENVCAKLLEALPHTPLGDFGLNFLFIEEDPDAQLFDLLETADNVNAYGDVVAKELSAFIKLDDKIFLRFLRRVSDGVVVFDFNYNHNVINKDNLCRIKKQLINDLFARSQNLIKDLYGIEGYHVVQHKFTTETEEKIKTDD